MTNSNLPMVSPVSYPRAGDNPAIVYLSSLSAHGRRPVASLLNNVSKMFGCSLESMPWQELRFQHIAAVREKLQDQGLAPASINLTLSAVRGVMRNAFNLGLISADDYERIKSVKAVKGSRVSKGRALSVGEITALLDNCAGTPKGIRDAAIIAVMYSSGLRREEVVKITLEQYNTENGELRVIGKGNKERILYIDNGAFDALSDWLTVRGNDPGALFCPVGKGGSVTIRPMTDQAIYNMLMDKAKEAGIERFSPHDLRRSFISELLDRGADIVTVKDLAGHASVQTTANYDRRGERAKKKAAGLLHVPYRKRKGNPEE